jgi:large subunit ribosomal protein L20
MTRVTFAVPSHRKKLRYFKRASGFRGGRHRLWRTVHETVLRAWAYATRDRRVRKRKFRQLWITRINAAARMRGMGYAALVDGLKQSGVALNRKELSHLALHDPQAFDQLVLLAQSKRPAKAAKS